MRHVLRLSGALLIAAGLLLFFWQDIREIFIDRVNDRMIESYHDDSRPVEVNRLESFVTGVDQSASYDMEGVAGVLRIESADIEEPVFSGPVTEEKLKSGLSFVDTTDHVDMQNIPIAGHRVEGPVSASTTLTGPPSETSSSSKLEMKCAAMKSLICSKSTPHRSKYWTRRGTIPSS